MNKADCDRWFVDEVLPLEGVLMRFLARNQRGAADLDDLRQEIYTRLYRSGLETRPASTRAFLFMTARNLLIDRGRRERVVSFELIGEPETVETVDVGMVERQMSARLEVRALQRAIDALPPRCRAVILLRKIEDLPQREVARRLGITEDTVERQVSKGVRALAQAVFGNNDGRLERPRDDGKKHA